MRKLMLALMAAQAATAVPPLGRFTQLDGQSARCTA
jgi:hypothetical protein